MQKSLAAAELINTFQELFTDLEHEQVVERLLRLVMADSRISRAVLLIPHEDQIRIEAVAQSSAKAVLPRVNFTKLQNIPHDLIRQSIDSGQSMTAVAQGVAQPCAAGTASIHLHPVAILGEVVALYYLESGRGSDILAATVGALAPVWTFSAYLFRNAQELRRYQRQSEEYSRAEQALWASDLFLHSMLNSSPALISIKDLNGNVMLASDHYKELAELSEASGRSDVFDIYPMEIAQSLWDSDFESSKAAQVIESELEVRHKDGTLHTYLMLKFPLRDEEGQIFSVCSICTDITERKMAEDAVREQQSRLNFMAFHDVLTGLPNRSLFYDRLNHGLCRAQRNGGKLALMMIDVDRFKSVNDTLGRNAGDQFLKAVARKVAGTLRKMDTVARIGGDEFIVILEGIKDVADARQVANKLLRQLAQPSVIDNEMVQTSASIGISVFPQDGNAADELLKRADIAMHKAKESGKNNYLYYTEGMDSSAVKFLVVEKDLRTAIEEGQLCLYYQPQVDLQTGDLVGVEALVRWNHPERGLIAPSHFIPLAEETGLIVPLGEWLLREAGAQQKRWMESGKYVGKIAVNLSPRQLRQRNFVERLGEILEEIDLPPKYLELEITETSAMEHAGETVSMLTQLNQMGLSLAIDDFGTGYSSLAYLKRFPIQKLKIDRSFIHDIHTDQNDASIANSIIGLAHNMQLNVVAEGVENELQASWLRKRGCDQAQGYLYAQPIPPEKLERFFTSGVASFKERQVEPELPF
ncbi:putative bifunctional diguanylate cyclase/phosphodiesterase [Gilvimarinus sp. F26214L]|uniref:putative bifunctional diguanylate cyclase/phosphodiesterase n=1 Tax=Gilvimarinus sp. DZF01 TaxID=3461371 RepID=UPI004045D78E